MYSRIKGLLETEEDRSFPANAPQLVKVEMPAKDLSDWFAYPKSTAPEMTDLPKYQAKPGEGILVLATMSFTAVAMACELGLQNKSELVPQLVLMDNGKQAAEFWELSRQFFFENSSVTQCQRNLNSFLRKHFSLFNYYKDDKVISERVFTEIEKYFNDIIQKYGYEYIRDVTLQTIYIKQDWVVSAAFVELKKYIDACGFRNVFIYAANIVLSTHELNAKQICENIYSLKPNLVIHSNMSYHITAPTKLCYFEKEENQPDNILEKMSHEVVLDENLILRGFEFFQMFTGTAQEYNYWLWKVLNKQIDVMLKKNKYDFDQVHSTFLLDCLLKLAEIDIHLPFYYFEPAKYNTELVFHLPFTFKQAQEIINQLNKKFPLLMASFPRLGQVEQNRIGHPTRISISTSQVISLIPAIEKLLKDKPEITKKYAFAKVIENISEIFAKQSISSGKTDCFEETLCYMASEYAKEKNTPVTLTTTRNSFQFDERDPGIINIFLNLPFARAHHIVDYLNTFAENSAKAENENGQDGFSTKIIVLTSTLMSHQFMDKLTQTVNNYPEAIKLHYRRLSGTIPQSDEQEKQEQAGLRRR